jgi:hypothetical protein
MRDPTLDGSGSSHARLRIDEIDVSSGFQLLELELPSPAPAPL